MRQTPQKPMSERIWQRMKTPEKIKPLAKIFRPGSTPVEQLTVAHACSALTLYAKIFTESPTIILNIKLYRSEGGANIHPHNPWATT